MVDFMEDLFDFDRDGQLDSIELALAYQVLFGYEEEKDADIWDEDTY